ncbi:MAG TPA: hypothetical protein VLT36_26080 [Candidatus Dormibacteraeota bacterium]|nr:hypothetical protein [Candidatus Dormibacteraeota bacterium]
MNRSILIVICDFLLISLLAFSSVDVNKAVDPTAKPQMKLDMGTNAPVPDSGKDLAAVMKLALEDEKKNRDRLIGELSRAREVAGAGEKQSETLRQKLQTREQESQKLAQERSQLQQQFAVAQTNLVALNEKLQSSSSEALLSREKLAAMEAELKKQNEQSSALQKQLSSLARSNELALAEKQQLAGQLKVAETEKRYATEQAARMTEEVKVEREEKAKLAEGVKVLASRSGELAQEVRENRPMAANTIFTDFLANRVEANFFAVRPGIFGIDSNKRKDTETALVTDGTNTYAICHVQDTPLSFWNPGTEWDSLTGTLSKDTSVLPIRSLSFYWQDPRLVFMPVKADEVKKLGVKPYRFSRDPFKFQDAVLVGPSEGYYGECRFQIDVSTPEYVKLDRSFLKGLVGKFNPSRGDFVFSRNGELLGVMANGSYCMMLRNFEASATFTFGKDVRAQRTGEILSRFYTVIAELPQKLQ